MIEACGLLVVVVSDNLLAVEDGEEGDKESAVPVISHPAPVVTLAGEVAEGIQGKVLVIIEEHLLLLHADT